MRRNRRRGAQYEEHSYWQSYSDMMAALLLIFILIIAITLAIYRQKTVALEVTQADLDAAKIDLENYRAEIDASKAELEDSLLKLQAAYAEAAMTKEELDAAYLEIENAKIDLDQAYQDIEDAQSELAFTKSELQNIIGIRTDIIGELQKKFDDSSMKVDAQTGSITFSSDVIFEYGKANLTSASKNSLREIIPVYLDVLLQDAYKDYIAEIIIEGHTDTSGSYKTNMELSANRAMAVAEFCLDKKNGLDEEQIQKLQSLLTVNGRSFSSPVYKPGTTEIDMDASRRVEIKFRLKEEEMIEKIAEILGQQN